MYNYIVNVIVYKWNYWYEAICLKSAIGDIFNWQF